MNTRSQTIDVEVEISRRKAGKRGRKGKEENRPSPHIPRISRLMALAIKFQGMVDRRQIGDYADLARLGYVTRARITQIMNLLLLAPEIQADILSWAVNTEDSRQIAEHDVRKIAHITGWDAQRKLWRDLLGRQLRQS
jgi:hypothetical protein